MIPKFKTVRTTLTLPVELIERSQHFIDSGAIPSRNALIVAAVEQFLQELEQQEIDRQFEAMAEDQDYQTLNQQLSESFAESDWEALTEAETR
jgi:metal-responsive CopG/Arc/MetJ family transcriptional regulator